MSDIIECFNVGLDPNLIRSRPDKPSAEGIAKLIQDGGCIQAITLTFRVDPFHSYDQKKLYKISKSFLRSVYSNTRKRWYLDAHVEMTTSNICHWHCLLIGETQYINSKLSSKWRKKYGFVFISKTVHDLQQWLVYINKQNIFRCLTIGRV